MGGYAGLGIWNIVSDGGKGVPGPRVLWSLVAHMYMTVICDLRDSGPKNFLIITGYSLHSQKFSFEIRSNLSRNQISPAQQGTELPSFSQRACAFPVALRFFLCFHTLIRKQSGSRHVPSTGVLSTQRN